MPDASSSTTAAAICLSGQVRTLRVTYPSIVANLSSIFGRADIFLFVNPDDGDDRRRLAELRDVHGKLAFASKRSGRRKHSREELRDMLAAKEPVRIQTYSMQDFSSAAPPRGPCMARQGFPPESDFSYHGPQFWGVQRCVQMVRAHEAATGARYDYIVRARPDDAFSRSGLAELSCGIRRSERTQRGLKSSAVWMAGDGFQVATRPALPTLEAIWDEFKGSACSRLHAQTRRWWSRTRCATHAIDGIRSLYLYRIAAHRFRVTVGVPTCPAGSL